MVITIRKAMIDDIPTLNQFEQDIYWLEQDLDPVVKQDGGVKYFDFEKILKARLQYAVIAEADGKPVGCGFAKIKKDAKWSIHKQYGYIYFIYVLKEFRRKNIATKITGALFEWLRSKGITEIRLNVYANNTSALQVYDKLGFEDYAMIKRLKTNLTEEEKTQLSKAKFG
jgi:ribosomal protein S18 acetylase RimI-like enzyme